MLIPSQRRGDALHHTDAEADTDERGFVRVVTADFDMGVWLDPDACTTGRPPAGREPLHDSKGRNAPMSTTAPWAMRQVTDRLPIAPADYTSVVLDADTQTATYTNAAGTLIEMGEHGTNKTKGTTTTSGGSDGSAPTPATNDDNNVDYESD